MPVRVEAGPPSGSAPAAVLPVSDGDVAIVEVVAPAPALPAARTFADDPLGVREYVLDNGLHVLLSENHSQPEVFGAVVVRTGGANDPADDTGMAHYLEHMLFKGTTRLGTADWAAEAPLQARLVALYDELRAVVDGGGDAGERARVEAEIAEVVAQTYAHVIPNELDRMLGEIGSTGVNAFTEEDQTVYHNTFPASQIDAWLRIYAERFVDPVFRLFPTELEAVYEEKNISIDRFETAVYEAFVEHAWPAHPYGTQQILGEVEHLERPSLSVMRRYFETYYVPSNMALVLAGDFDAEAILPLIQASFGQWQPGPEPARRGGEVEPFAVDERFTVRLTPLRVGAVGYRSAAIGHPDYPVLRVARELLYNEQGSGMLDALVDEGRLLITLPFPLDHAEHGLELVFYAPRLIFQRFARAEALITGAYARVAAGDFDEAEMLALRDNLLREQDRTFERNEGRALAMAEAFSKGDGWAQALRDRQRLQGLTKAELVAVAGEYFGERRLLMRSRVGRVDKTHLHEPSSPPVEPVRGRSSEFYRELTSRDAPAPTIAEVDPGVVARRELAPRVELSASPNPHNQLFALDVEFGVGSEAIPALDVGAPYLARLAPAGTTPAEFRRQLTRLGLTLDVEVDAQRFWLHLEGPDAHLEDGVELLAALLDDAEADERRFRQLRKEVWGYERVNREDPRRSAEALREYVMYGEGSRYLRAFGPREIRRLGSRRALAAVAEARGYATHFRYVGPRSLDALEVVIAEDFAATLTAELAPAVPWVIRERQLPDTQRVYFMAQKGAVQTQVFFAVEGEPVPRDQRAAADAYTEFMGGGMAGLIFQEIREFRALAYSAWGVLRRDPDTVQDSMFLAYVGCQADKTEEAVDTTLALIREFPARAEDLEGVRTSLIHALETDAPSFRGLQARLEHWARLGYAGDPRPELLAGYQRVEFEDVRALFEAQVKGRPVTLMVVGDPRRVDLELLRKWGEVVEVDRREVFSR
nr:M16 family metallopeptidase [Pseudenhygromyxa sp. WMMC2535]